MGKRIVLMITICVLLSSGGDMNTVKAANIKSPYNLEQAIGKAPNVKAYMTGSKMQEASEVSGTVGEISLTRKGAVKVSVTLFY